MPRRPRGPAAEGTGLAAAAAPPLHHHHLRAGPAAAGRAEQAGTPARAGGAAARACRSASACAAPALRVRRGCVEARGTAEEPGRAAGAASVRVQGRDGQARVCRQALSGAGRSTPAAAGSTPLPTPQAARAAFRPAPAAAAAGTPAAGDPGRPAQQPAPLPLSLRCRLAPSLPAWGARDKGLLLRRLDEAGGPQNAVTRVEGEGVESSRGTPGRCVSVMECSLGCCSNSGSRTRGGGRPTSTCCCRRFHALFMRRRGRFPSLLQPLGLQHPRLRVARTASYRTTGNAAGPYSRVPGAGACRRVRRRMDAVAPCSARMVHRRLAVQGVCGASASGSAAASLGRQLKQRADAIGEAHGGPAAQQHPRCSPQLVGAAQPGG